MVKNSALWWLKNIGCDIFKKNLIILHTANPKQKFEQFQCVSNHYNKNENVDKSKQDFAKQDFAKQDFGQQIINHHEIAPCTILQNKKTKQEALNELKTELHHINCDLKDIALSTVFGDGDINAKIMIIGEAPGEEEDKLGLPFVGKSGQLLQKILHSFGLERKDVYITNVVPWRPPYNRQPSQDEIDKCLPILEKHISIIKPSCIFLLGSTAAKSVMNQNIANRETHDKIISNVNHYCRILDKNSDNKSNNDLFKIIDQKMIQAYKNIELIQWDATFHNKTITELRGKAFAYKNLMTDSEIIAICTFHPSYILRSPTKKQDIYKDVFLLNMWKNIIKIP